MAANHGSVLSDDGDQPAAPCSSRPEDQPILRSRRTRPCSILSLIGSACRGSIFCAAAVHLSHTVRRALPHQAQSLVGGAGNLSATCVLSALLTAYAAQPAPRSEAPGAARGGVSTTAEEEMDLFASLDPPTPDQIPHYPALSAGAPAVASG